MALQLAFAYLDPGAGSYLAQFLMAGVLGLVFSVKLYWKKITGRWSQRVKKPDSNKAIDG